MPSLSANELTLTIKAADQASATLKKVQKELDSVGSSSSKAGKEANGLSRFWGSATGSSIALAKGIGIAGVAVGALASVGMGSLINYTLRSTREVQGYVASIKGLTANTAEASDVMKSMIDYVQGKPFDRVEVLGAARNLLVFGRSAAETKADIELLGRASIISGKDIGGLSQIFGRVASSGRLMNDDFNQLMYAGVNIGKTLSEDLGLSMKDLRGEMEDGNVTFEQFRAALERALPADAVEANSNTIDNKLLSLQSSFRNLGFSILGVDFSKVDGSGQPLVKEGGVLDRGIQLIAELTKLLKDPAVQAGFQLIGEAAAKAAGVGLKLFVEGVKALPGILGWLRDNAPMVASVIGGAMTPVLILLGVAAWGAAAGFIAMNWPILALIAIGALLGAAINWLVGKFGGWGVVMEKVKGIGQTVHDFFTQTLPNGIATAFQWIVGKAMWLKDNFWETVGFIIGFFATLPIKLPIYVFNAIVGIINWLRNVNWGEVFQKIGDAFGKVWDWMWGVGQKLWDKLSGMDWGQIFTNLGKGLANGVLGLIEGAINGALHGLPGKPKVSLPRFATGTNFAPGGLAWVGERGPELVNLPRGSQVKTASQSRQISERAAQGRAAGVNVTQNIYNQVDYDRGIQEIGFRLRARVA